MSKIFGGLIPETPLNTALSSSSSLSQYFYCAHYNMAMGALHSALQVKNTVEH